MRKSAHFMHFYCKSAFLRKKSFLLKKVIFAPKVIFSAKVAFYSKIAFGGKLPPEPPARPGPEPGGGCAERPNSAKVAKRGKKCKSVAFSGNPPFS